MAVVFPVRTRSPRLDLPWESGTFGFLSAQTTTLASSLETLLRLPVPVPVPKQCSLTSSAAKALLPGTGTSACFRAPGAVKGLSWSSQEERNKRVQALCKWSNLLKLAPDLFSAATVEKLPVKGDESMVEHLDMLFSKKSTNTLLTRAHPLTRFVLWKRRTCPDDAVSENVVWMHCRWLQSCAAASSIDSLVGSLNFVHGTLGLQLSVQDLLSARVRGVAHAHLKTKEDRGQAPALSVAQLTRRWLEYYILNIIVAIA